jgi:hypothetical protein
MTEAEWLASSDPRRMFNWLWQNGTTNRHRIGHFFVVCCDLIPPSVAERQGTEGAYWTADEDSQIALTDAEFHLSGAVMEAMRAIGVGESERVRLGAILRDIFGNPFRPVALDASWLTSDVVALARQMYESRDFTAMPILADALQDAGCEDEAVLSHCRSDGPHVRGCWVIDLLTGRE